MLSSIKDKLWNVKRNVTLFGSGADKDNIECSSVDLDAGSELLTHFQNNWESIHKTNEENAKLAEKLAHEVSKISSKVERDKENFTLLTHLLTNSNLKNNIVHCTKQIEDVFEAVGKVEVELLQLEDLIENIEFEKMKKQHRYHLHQYKLRKDESLTNFEAALKDDYGNSVLAMEAKKKKELEERRQVFQEAFNSDLEVFKNCGAIPKLDLPKKQPSALLEEIQVDYDEKELDQFFADDK